jgi:hypothetical protein
LNDLPQGGILLRIGIRNLRISLPDKPMESAVPWKMGRRQSVREEIGQTVLFRLTLCLPWLELAAFKGVGGAILVMSAASLPVALSFL